MIKYQLKSGKIIEFSLAPVETALALYRAIVSECQRCKFELSFTEEDTILSLLSKNSEPLLRVMGSEYVMEAIKDCCAKVIYNKQKFSMDLFEDEKARGDFFGVMLLVAVENLRPFFPQASSLLNNVLSPFLM